MIRFTLTLAALACAFAPTFAADAVVRLGDATVRYDDARWKALPSEAAIRFEPQGKAESRLDAVELHVADAATSCTQLATAAFAVGHYDLSDLSPTPWSVAGMAGERFEAHTRCRNATPRGAVACVKVAGSAYVLRSVNFGCEGTNLFSGIDPLTEIAGGMTFTAPR